MAKISKLELNELNKELHKLEGLHNRLSKVEEGLSIAAFQSHQLDYVHGRPTFNNLVFTWTGGTTKSSVKSSPEQPDKREQPEAAEANLGLIFQERVINYSNGTG
jgi:hypothetical protein